MTKFERLVKRIDEIYNSNKVACDSLPQKGKRGGHNAKRIPGWALTGVSIISKACLRSNLPMLKWWSGLGTTPSWAIPAVVAEEIREAYDKIYKNFGVDYLVEAGKERALTLEEIDGINECPAYYVEKHWDKVYIHKWNIRRNDHRGKFIVEALVDARRTEEGE